MAHTSSNERDFADAGRKKGSSSAYLREMERRVREFFTLETSLTESLCQRAKSIWVEGFGNPRLSGTSRVGRNIVSGLKIAANRKRKVTCFVIDVDGL